MELNKNSNRNTVIKIIGSVIILALAWLGFAKMGKTPQTSEVASGTDAASSTDVITNDSAKYKNGTYTAIGDYSSPGGKEEIELTLTLRDDVVTGAVFVGKATNPGSIYNQDNFKAGFEQYVVGKNIDSINLTVVNGSSLTPKGFNDAVVKIKAQAQA